MANKRRVSSENEWIKKFAANERVVSKEHEDTEKEILMNVFSEESPHLKTLDSAYASLYCQVVFGAVHGNGPAVCTSSSEGIGNKIANDLENSLERCCSVSSDGLSCCGDEVCPASCLWFEKVDDLRVQLHKLAQQCNIVDNDEPKFPLLAEFVRRWRRFATQYPKHEEFGKI